MLEREPNPLYPYTEVSTGLPPFQGFLAGAAPSSLPTENPPTNPKQLYGDKKVPMGIVHPAFIAGTAVALAEGRGKYGENNYLVAPVCASTYYHALYRHTSKWWFGEKADPVTKVQHLFNAAACLHILIATELHGTLIDDRPPKVDMNAFFVDLESTLAHLKDLHKDHNPIHYTEKKS